MAHFWFIFNFIFKPFFKNELENEIENELKMTIFAKMEPFPCSCKNAHFHFHFDISFFSLFQTQLLLQGPASSTMTPLPTSHQHRNSIATYCQYLLPCPCPLPHLQELQVGAACEQFISDPTSESYMSPTCHLGSKACFFFGFLVLLDTTVTNRKKGKKDRPSLANIAQPMKHPTPNGHKSTHHSDQ